jgi:glycosyltransferase involved in cell wall biosynthesis
MISLRPLKIAFCIDSFRIGGTELNAVRTAEALDAKRFELCVIHLHEDGPLRSRYEKLGVRMEYFPINNLYSARTSLQGMRLGLFLRRWGADVVQTHDIYTNIFVATWARLFTRAKILAGRRWLYEAPRPGLVKINRWSNLFAHRILANSRGVADLLSGEEKVPSRKIVEVPNFLDESAFDRVDEKSRCEQRRTWGLPDDAFVVGCVARLSPVKNHAMLLRAVASLSSRFHVVLIGDGPSRTELELLATNLGISSRVHFIGEVLSTINLHQFFDVSALCSNSEGFPNTVIEAMAASRSVVATEVGGVVDVIKSNSTGVLIPPDGVKQLAETLQQFEADPLLCARFGEAGQAVVREGFHKNIVIEKLSAIYERLAMIHPASSHNHLVKGDHA